jgi:hypothetical protein
MSFSVSDGGSNERVVNGLSVVNTLRDPSAMTKR